MNNFLLIASIISLITAIAPGSILLHAENFTVHEYLTAIRDRYERIEDYQCLMHEFGICEDKREEKIMHYYFKKPGMIRVNVLDGNRAFDRGSVGVYTGGNRITGHRGGIMKGIVLSVRKDNPLAMSIRGETIEKSNVLAVIERMERLVENSHVTITEKADYVEFVFVPFDPAANEGVSRDVVLIERESMLIIRMERYEGERLVQQVIRERYIINAGLPEELFDASIETEQFRESGVHLIDNNTDGESVAP